ncbi:hypothetical protein AVEN_211805-1 [Araneus ventricosus]|uniref:Phospholipase A2-like central domain-containing protein n=1 Tax=Araneus ventricosus TaxID=182803 RepID=A0A4Y2KPQ9_ARAVE|nr:hypothetical protein AVEN_211805-1 [Araneus ventricosus]
MRICRLLLRVHLLNAGTNEIPNGASERRRNYGNSTSEPLSGKSENLREMSTNRIFKPTTESSGLWNFFFGSKGTEEAEATSEDPNVHENLKMMPPTMNPKPTAKSSGLWSLVFWNEGSSDKSTSVSVTEQNEGKSTEKPTGKPENQKTEFDNVILSSTNTSWSLWNYVFGVSGTSDNSSSVPVTEQKEGNSTEKPTDKPENQKSEFNTVVLSSTNTSWSLWNYLLGVSDSSKSSNEIRSFENLERSPTTESSIYFENSTDLEYLTTGNAAVWNIVMPGTKWCGSGNIASNDDDLGYFEDVDRCCRAHDKCNDLMVPGESKHNLTNTSPFTVSVVPAISAFVVECLLVLLYGNLGRLVDLGVVLVIEGCVQTEQFKQ